MAGSTNRTKLVGLSAVIVANSIPMTTAITDPRIQLVAATRCGDSPVRSAPFSLSADASVAQPNRVKR